MADFFLYRTFSRAFRSSAALCVCVAGLLFLWAVCALPGKTFAAVQVVSSLSWKSSLTPGAFFPPCLAAVDKGRGQLFILQYPGSLVLTRSFAAYVEGGGAVNTPHVIEGVYFVDEAASSASQIAPVEQVAINYPNPVDRLRAKMPLKGVIAGKSSGAAHKNDAGVLLYDGDVRALAKVMQPGMPVVFTQSLEQAPGNTRAASIAAVLVQRVKDWADAWSSLSTDFFDFYDEDAYEVSTESFEAFRAQKVRLFRKHEWIRNDLNGIRVLEGPGYWVTWFGQEYSDPASCSSGVRRLYWMRDESGVFKIVGMEWVSNLRQPDDHEADYPLIPPRDSHDMPSAPTAGAEAQPFMKEGYPLDLVRKRQNEHKLHLPPKSFTYPEENDGASPIPREIDARVLHDISQYVLRSQASRDHVEKTVHGMMARPDPKAFLLAGKREGRYAVVQPKPVKNRTGSTASSGDMEELSPYEAYAQELVAKPALSSGAEEAQGEATQTAPAVTPEPVAEAAQAAAPEAVTPAPEAVKTADSGAKPVDEVQETVEAQKLAVKEAPQAVKVKTGEETAPPAEPEIQTGPVAGDESAAPVEPVVQAEPVIQEDPAHQTEPAEPMASVENAETGKPAVRAEAAQADAVQPEVAQADAVQPEAAPADAAQAEPAARKADTQKMSSTDFAAAKTEVSGQIERWRKAWLSADVDAYMEFYANDAVQGVRGSPKAIRFHKERVWPSFPPARVELSDIAFTAENSMVVATMKQRYADSTGKEDYGMKTLTFELRNGVWLITREEWSKLSK